jgi:molybdopterin-guanine dinucleotide biosynthesis protein A
MISLAILAGGKSDRMGQDKGLLPFLGRPLILRIVERLGAISDDIIVATDRLSEYANLGLQLFPDIQPGRGALGGLHTSLQAAKNSIVAAVACDMPFVNIKLLEHECDLLIHMNVDIVIPFTKDGLEPLHAIYRRETCLPAVKSAIEAGHWKLIDWLSEVKVFYLLDEERRLFDPQLLAFCNLNTQEEFERAEKIAIQENNH